MPRRKAAIPESKSGVKGTFRLQITEEGKVVGDSGWCKNQITNDGVNEYLVYALISSAGRLYPSYIALGQGTAPASNATTLQSEVTSRQTLVAASSSSKRAARFTATFDSGISFVGATVTLQNIGLVNSSNAGTVFAGNTFATSTCATNQNVNVTYDISFT